MVKILLGWLGGGEIMIEDLNQKDTQQSEITVSVGIYSFL